MLSICLLGGKSKRTVGLVMQNFAGNLVATIPSYLYPAKDAPRFIPASSTLIATLSMSTVLAIIMTVYFRRENARRDRDHKPPDEYTDEERLAEHMMGDKATFFRFTV